MRAATSEAAERVPAPARDIVPHTLCGSGESSSVLARVPDGTPPVVTSGAVTSGAVMSGVGIPRAVIPVATFPAVALPGAALPAVDLPAAAATSSVAQGPVVSGEGFELLDPWFLLLGLAALAVWGWRSWRGGAAALPSAAVSMFESLPKTVRQRCRRLPGILLVLGACGLSVALARPVTRELMPLRERGVDILMVVDISSSMRVRDQEVDGEPKMRIEVARERAMEFARGRIHDRVGLVTFAKYPELRCPLTLDMRALTAFLRSIQPISERNPEEDGTAIGAALGQAVRFLEDSDAESKVVVLLSDGQQTVDFVGVEEAAKLAKDAGLRVHTIGFGVGELLRTPFGEVVRREIDFEDLREIANQTDGRFFRAANDEALKTVFEAIDELEKVELEDPRYRTADWFGWPLLVGVALCALALLLETLWIREVP